MNRIIGFVVLSSVLCGCRGASMSMTKAKEMLSDYGYLESATNALDEEVDSAIKEFQEFVGMEVTGELDDETIEYLQNKPRCGMPDHVKMEANSQRTYKWRNKDLTYKIMNFTSRLSPARVKFVVEKSIRQWTGGVNLRITETSSDDADLKIFFSPQDGPLKVLGYAYFPEHGGIYFDSLERWSEESSSDRSVIDFNWVSTHELGHALGLSHSEELESIMYPYYRHVTTALSNNDRSRIRQLYGTATMDELCSDPKIDEMLFYPQTNQHYLFKGDKFWTVSETGVNSGPFSANTVFKGFPGAVDAALATSTATYFIKGSSFYRYQKNFRKRYIKKSIITMFENMPKNLDAAFFYPDNATIYFFKGSDFYTIRGRGRAPTGTVEAMRISEHFPGIPDNIDAATILNFGERILFVKNDQFYIFDMTRKRLESGPLDTKRNWFKC